MTPRGARAFLPTLRKVERELSMPVPARIRILRELEFDLEELRRRFEAEGLPAEDARARSVDALVPDGGALRELGRLHTPRYQRLTRHLTEDGVRFLERSALALVTGSVLLVAIGALMQVDLLTNPSPFLWVVLGLGAVSFAAVIREAFALWVKGDHTLDRDGSSLVIWTTCGILIGGLLGVFLDGYRIVGTLEGAPRLSDPRMLGWLAQEAELLAVTLVLALAAGLAWFVMTQWLTLVSGARREVLGLDSTETPQSEVT